MTNVTLRPLEQRDVEVFLARPDDGGVPRSDVDAEERRRRLERLIAQRGSFRDGRLDLAVLADGVLAGRVDVRRPDGAWPPGVVELGIGLFPEARGRGVGTRAVALLVERLLADGAIHRVQASTDLENVGMRSVLERVGFTFEGVLRGFMPDADGRADYALYALTRADVTSG